MHLSGLSSSLCQISRWRKVKTQCRPWDATVRNADKSLELAPACNLLRALAQRIGIKRCRGTKPQCTNQTAENKLIGPKNNRPCIIWYNLYLSLPISLKLHQGMKLNMKPRNRKNMHLNRPFTDLSGDCLLVQAFLTANHHFCKNHRSIKSPDDPSGQQESPIHRMLLSCSTEPVVILSSGNCRENDWEIEQNIQRSKVHVEEPTEITSFLLGMIFFPDWALNPASMAEIKGLRPKILKRNCASLKLATFTCHNQVWLELPKLSLIQDVPWCRRSRLQRAVVTAKATIPVHVPKKDLNRSKKNPWSWMPTIP